VSPAEAPLARELDLLGEVAPGARAALTSAWRAARDEVDPAVLGVARRRIEDQLGLGAEGAGDEPAGPAQAAVAALADQFAFYVPGVTAELREPVRAALGDDGLRTLIDALYVVDQTARLRLAHARLFDAGDLPASPAPVRAPERPLGTALGELHAEAMRLRRLDERTTEIVRLKAANHHDCKT
jgi:hypothetical protein